MHKGRHADVFQTGARQKAPPRGRREGHGHLKLGVIAPTRLFIGMRPVEIEDVFALTMAFGVKRRDGNDLTVHPGDKVLRLPAGPRTDGSAVFQRFQKAMRRERVDWASAIRRLRCSAGVPLIFRDLGNLADHGDLKCLFSHVVGPAVQDLRGAEALQIKRAAPPDSLRT